MNERSAPVVSLRSLTRDFGTTRAVDCLTFDVAPGELFGIVGPDGAGKTTTLRMLAGVLRPTAGDATIAGLSVTQDPEAVKPHIAYMSQRFGLYADLTVRENIEFYADLYHVPKSDRPARLERLYQFSALGQFKDRLAGKLSGGMKQKLALCCALIHHPEVMLLDEPTFGVDPISRRDLWLILHEMVADGMTVLVSTAYLDEAERCDRVGLLHHGHVVALDTPDNLQQRFQGDIYAVQTDNPRHTRDLLRQHSNVRDAVLFGDTVHATMDDHIRDWPAARQILESEGVSILSEGLVEPTLENVFIELVGSREARDA
ncbi:MAG: ABC transporter ATP-binding protein [Gemmatimonadota bacterium]|nr:MAG: ABC transporter ATP-binding protein [Gemmatimonadota bacterium]